LFFNFYSLIHVQSEEKTLVYVGAGKV